MFPSNNYITALPEFTPIGRRIKATFARCAKGSALHKEWRDAIQAEKDMQKSSAILCGPRKYDKHRAKCDACRDFDLWRMSIRYKTRGK